MYLLWSTWFAVGIFSLINFLIFLIYTIIYLYRYNIWNCCMVIPRVSIVVAYIETICYLCWFYNMLFYSPPLYILISSYKSYNKIHFPMNFSFLFFPYTIYILYLFAIGENSHTQKHTNMWCIEFYLLLYGVVFQARQ